MGSAADIAADTGVQPGAHSSKIRAAVQQLEGFRRGSAPGSPAASAPPAGSLATAVPGTLPSTPAATAGSQQQAADFPSSAQRPADSHGGGLAAGGVSGDGRRAAGPGAAAAEPSAPGAAAADCSVGAPAADSAGAPATTLQPAQLASDVSATPPSTAAHGGAQAGAGRQAASGAGAGAAGGQHNAAASASSQLGASRQPAAAAQAAGTGGAAGQCISSLADSRQLGPAQNQVDRPTGVKMAAITDPDVGPVETAVAAAAALQADKEQAHQQTAAAEAPTARGAERQAMSAGTPSGRPSCVPAWDAAQQLPKAWTGQSQEAGSTGRQTQTGVGCRSSPWVQRQLNLRGAELVCLSPTTGCWMQSTHGDLPGSQPRSV